MIGISILMSSLIAMSYIIAGYIIADYFESQLSDINVPRFCVLAIFALWPAALMVISVFALGLLIWKICKYIWGKIINIGKNK